MNGHWIRFLPEAGTEALLISDRIAAAQRALKEARQRLAELESEADELANCGEWSDKEKRLARRCAQ